MSRYLNLYLHHIYYNLVIVLHDRMMMGLLPLLHGLQFTVYLFALKGYIYIFFLFGNLILFSMEIHQAIFSFKADVNSVQYVTICFNISIKKHYI